VEAKVKMERKEIGEGIRRQGHEGGRRVD